jgi:glycerol kinase
VKSAADAGNLLFGTIDTWIIWNLTQGSHITDVTNASRTLLMDLETLSWDESLLSDFGVPVLRCQRSRVLQKFMMQQKLMASSERRSQFVGILGDQHAAMVGQLCFERGDTKCTYGTGNFALVNTGTEIVRSKERGS